MCRADQRSDAPRERRGRFRRAGPSCGVRGAARFRGPDLVRVAFSEAGRRGARGEEGGRAASSAGVAAPRSWSTSSLAGAGGMTAQRVASAGRTAPIVGRRTWPAGAAAESARGHRAAACASRCSPLGGAASCAAARARRASPAARAARGAHAAAAPSGARARARRAQRAACAGSSRCASATPATRQSGQKWEEDASVRIAGDRRAWKVERAALGMVAGGGCSAYAPLRLVYSAAVFVGARRRRPLSVEDNEVCGGVA
jgi:hypothetical protein